MASVHLERVTKTWPGGVLAVSQVTLTIPDQKLVVLVGPSGCGKSTLLRMIAGLEEPSSGTISIGERIVNAVPPRDRDVAMVFQNYALYPHMSVYDNMAFGLRLRGVPRGQVEQRVRSAAETLGLSSLLERMPRQLSGGQAQRVALGRALVRQPSVFLFDEPLSNLDAQHRAEMRRELSALHQRLNATMLLVTHDQTEAMTLGEQIVVMHAGEIQQVGDPASVYARPANQFVAGFVGTPAMNFLAGTLLRTADGVACRFGDVVWRIPPELVAGRAPAGDAPVTLGIRPESFVVAEDSAASADHHETVTIGIDDVHNLGHELLAFFRLFGHDCVARLDARRQLARGQSIALRIDLRNAHLFDSAGQNTRSIV